MDVLSYLVSTRVAADVGALVFLKGSAVLLGLALATHLLRGRSSALRHRVWAAGLITLVTLPLFARAGLQWSLATLPYPAETPLVGIDAVETRAPAARQSGSPLGGFGIAADGEVSQTPGVVAPSRWRGLPHELPPATVLLLVWWVGVLSVVTWVTLDLARVGALRFRSRKLD